MLEQFVNSELDGKLDYVPIVFNLLAEIDTITPIIDPQKARGSIILNPSKNGKVSGSD